MKKKNCFFTAVVGLYVSTSGGMALAQNQDSASSKPKIIEEILVTAEHRQVSLQATQISLTAFSEQTIKDLGIDNAGDISEFTPNVTFSSLAVDDRDSLLICAEFARGNPILASTLPSACILMVL